MVASDCARSIHAIIIIVKSFTPVDLILLVDPILAVGHFDLYFMVQ